VIILAIDVIPYYPTHYPALVDRWFIVGNNYPAYPGVYHHIDKGGIYTIAGDEKGNAIIMNSPNGTSNAYSHRLRHYFNARVSVTIAHNTLFYDTTDKITEHIKDSYLPLNYHTTSTVTKTSTTLL
jgi:hypothetical protein